MATITNKLKDKLLHHLKVSEGKTYKDLGKKVQAKLIKHFSKDEVKESKRD